MQENELILIDKPAGMTSFGVVARIRRVLSDQEYAKRAVEEGGEQTETAALPTRGSLRGNIGSPQGAKRRVKVGHAGTLDPFATGLLTILTGKMTKRAGEFTKLDKIYEATIVLGQTSTTADPEGEITHVSDKIPTLEEIQAALTHFAGEITQTPPIFSAIKINGRRAYDLARKGQQPDIPPRQVTIHSITLVDYSYPELKITTHVSSGTYIRSLATDIGDYLATDAYLSQLRRTQVGDFSIDQAKTLLDLDISD